MNRGAVAARPKPNVRFTMSQAPDPETVASARVHLGPYRIEERLGAGGMGEVFRATDTRLHRTVAVKMLRGRGHADAAARQRFRQEACAASALNHPNICTVHDVGEADGQPYLVMEYLEGETLAARLARGPLPLGELLDVAIQVADALEAAHAHGIVHRDIKPANVFITRRQQAKVMDFGLAKVIGVAGRRGWRNHAGAGPAHRTGRGRRHGGVHVAGAGARRADRRPQRPVLVRRDALRDGHRREAVPGRHDGR